MSRQAEWDLVVGSQRKLLAACEALDGEAIERATFERERALSDLRSTIENPSEFAGRLAVLTHEATDALESVQQKIRADLLDVRRGVRAAQGYQGSSSRRVERKSSALDRSG